MVFRFAWTNVFAGEMRFTNKVTPRAPKCRFS
jgi:hypothetical protein